MSTHIEDVDLLVVGGGKAGKTLAMDRAKAGQRVAMVERGMIGGTCINVACIPTKALVAAARALRTTRRAAEFGIRVGEPEVDVALLRAHKQGVIEGMESIPSTARAGRSCSATATSSTLQYLSFCFASSTILERDALMVGAESENSE